MSVESTPQLMNRALRRVMSPLVKLMLSKGMTYPQFMELMKTVFFEVAERDFRLNDRPQTDSRISLLTGLHRKDIKRLREIPAAELSLSTKSTPLGAQVVARWLSHPDFCAVDGTPLPLPRMRVGADPASFDDLVSAVSKDIRPRALLDEWLNSGVVQIDATEQVCLNLAAFVPQAGLDSQLFYFGLNVQDHLAAATENICAVQPPFLERSVHYRMLPASAVDLLATQAKQSGMQLLLEMNRLAAAHAQEAAMNPEQDVPLERFTFGVYFYHTADVDGSGDD